MTLSNTDAKSNNAEYCVKLAAFGFVLSNGGTSPSNVMRHSTAGYTGWKSCRYRIKASLSVIGRFFAGNFCRKKEKK